VDTRALLVFQRL
jgi:hypothetical protein